MKSFLIIGMGSFGHHLARALSAERCEIMIVDSNEKAIEDLLSYDISAKIGDCTKEETLRELGVESFDACFVCMAENFLANLQITSLLKELGAKKVFSKVDEDVQAKFLLRNGADKIIYPDFQMAARIAMTESSDNIFDCIELERGYVICEIEPISQWIGKSLKDLDFRSRYNMNILVAKSGDKVFTPSADYVLKKDEHIMVMGQISDIKKIVK